MKDLSMHIMDIMQNSVVAGASLITMEIAESRKDNFWQFSISDDGCGMDANTLAKVTDPYYTSRTTRKVGLGIPLLKQNAERCGGFLNMESEPGKGTTLVSRFELTHLDRPVLGDVPGVIVLTVSAHPEIEFVYTHKTNDGEFVFDTREIKEVLEGMPLSDPKIIRYLREMIEENLLEINYSK